MQIVTVCPHCGQRYTTPATSIGEVAPCMKCGQKFIISEKPPVGLSRPHEVTTTKSGWKLALKLIIIAIITLIVINYIAQSTEQAHLNAKSEADRIMRDTEKYMKQKQLEREYPWATEDGLRQLRGY